MVTDMLADAGITIQEMLNVSGNLLKFSEMKRHGMCEEFVFKETITKISHPPQRIEKAK